MSAVRFRPLAQPWPKPATAKRRRGPFTVSYDVVMHDLDRELAYLKVREALVETDMAPADFRKLDGRPFADARPSSPKVLLTFILPEVGMLAYACDAYLHWLDNLRAISLTLTALRAVDRYQATTGREQYRGFKRLGSGSAEPAAQRPAMTSEEAADLISRLSRMDRAAILDDAELAAAAIRIAEKRSHPDAGGDTAAFQDVQEAKTVLQLRHGTAERASA